MRLNDFKFLQLAKKSWTADGQGQYELSRDFLVDGQIIEVTVTKSGEQLLCSCRIGGGAEYFKTFRDCGPQKAFWGHGFTSGFAPMFASIDEAVDTVISDCYLDAGENFITECNQIISQRLKTAGASKGVGYFFTEG